LPPASSTSFWQERNLRTAWPMQTLLGPIPPQKKVGRRRFASVPH